MESPIRRIRKKLSLSQYQFSLALGISQSLLSQIESGYISLSKGVVKALSQFDFDTKKLVSLQQKFVERRRSEWNRKLVAKLRRDGRWNLQ